MSYKDGFKEQTVAAGQNIKERDYWLKKLSGGMTRTILPYEYRQPGTGREKPLTAALPVQLTGSAYASMLKISNKSDVRLHILLLTGWLILLHRYTSAADIIIGVPTYRQAVEGQLINTALALRNTVNSRMTVKELLMQVGQTILEADQNQNYPIDALVYKLNLPGAGGDFPLFDMSILLEEIHAKHYLDHIKQNILISFHKTSTALEGTIEYNDRLYSEAFMKSVITHYRQVLENFLIDVGTPIGEVEILPVEEKQQLLEKFNDNKAGFPREKTLVHIFAEQVERTPGSIAIVCPGNFGHGRTRTNTDDNRVITYCELDGQVNRLTGVLITKGVVYETIVAVMMERSIEMMVAILAVFKAGGAYLPIDPDTPQERIDYMLKDSNAKILLNKSEIRNAESREQTNSNDKNSDAQTKNHHPGAGFNTANLAYIIYTSGSTGKPKGAMVEHIGMMNHMWAKVRTLQITSASIVAQTASHTFDISVWQFFVALTQGGCTVIYPESIIMDPMKLAGLLVENRVTILELVPSYLAILLDAIENRVPRLALAYLLVTGEEIKPALVNRWFAMYPGIKMVNAYGPTEASDDITQHVLAGPLEHGQHVPIGKPLQNFDIYIVDEEMQLCPLGIKGEICVSGTGVGRGYLNRPELTAKNFTKIIKSFAGVQGGLFQKPPLVLYKTGDLGRWLPDGSIEFFGRKDYQVKIRGFRIELGEIENLLVSHPAVKEAVVIDREDSQDQKYLCAYFVASAETVDTGELKTFLSRSLPDYMTPAHFIRLPQIPLTPNGKIDRAALPAPTPGRVKGMIYISSAMLQQVKITPDTPGVPVPDNFSNDPARVLSGAEKQQLLYDFNNTATEYPQDKTIPELFIEQVHRTPDSIAFVGADPRVCPGHSVRPIRLTYRQLDEQSGRVARAFIEKGVRADDIVAIMMDRTVEMMVTILGILKSGAAYLPLDPDYPQERIDYMLKDSNAKILINKSETRNSKLETNLNKQNFNSSNLAYLIYTSGSTGMPKGAMIEHRSVVNFFQGMSEHLHFGVDDSILSLITVTFDIFVLEALFPLTRGSRLVLGSEKAQVDLRAAAALMRREKVSIFQATPSMLNLFLAETGTAQALKPLKYLLVGGEELLLPVLEKARRVVTGKIYNLYGPTETTVWSTIKDVSGGNDLNIGKPIANTQVYICAENGQLQPIGVAGELCIGGVGVARGYLNRPELTAEKIKHEINKSFAGVKGELFQKRPLAYYKTGDLARWLPDGNIEFLGRKDHQIQLKGIRVELGEIESIILKQQEITAAAVVVREDKSGEKYLRAALVSASELTDDRLRERLAVELPLYMIPTEFLQLEQMPLTPSGKINRKVIAAIEPPETGCDENEPGSYVAPETQIQQQIAAIWKEVLNTPKVGIHDNFFDLGGNSLGIIMVNNKLKEILQRNIPALVLFEYPTIADLCRYLEPKPVPGKETVENIDNVENGEIVRSGVKSRGKDRMQQRKTKLKEERVNQNK